MVVQANHASRIQTLVALLNDIGQAHEELLAVVEQKVAAMRTADTERIKAAVQREEELAWRIHEKEGLRRQLTENLLRGYGVGAAVAKRMSAAQLAARVGSPHAGLIHAAAQRLRKITARIAERNEVAQRISQSVLRHLREVFVAMTGGQPSAGGYSHDGGLRMRCAAPIFDAVG